MTQQTSSFSAPPTPEEAMDAWYKLHDGRPDSPKVSVWFPTSLPYGRLQTRTVYDDTHPHGRDTLDDGRTIAYVTVSGISFGGYLDDLELMFKAVDEQIQRLRYIEKELRDV